MTNRNRSLQVHRFCIEELVVTPAPLLSDRSNGNVSSRAVRRLETITFLCDAANIQKQPSSCHITMSVFSASSPCRRRNVFVLFVGASVRLCVRPEKNVNTMPWKVSYRFRPNLQQRRILEHRWNCGGHVPPKILIAWATVHFDPTNNWHIH